MSTERRDLIIAADCGSLRRRLGPTAWAVLEELLASSTGAGGRLRARVSVRGLAGALGLNKDTVARALSRLAAADLVVATQTRTTSGAFATGSYTVTIPASITLRNPRRTSTIEPSDTNVTSPESTPSSTQLTLTLDT